MLDSIASAPRRAVDLGIRAYQRHLSPRKGFACASRVVRGGQSCSEAVRGILTERGLLGGALPTLARFHACYQAAALLNAGPAAAVRGVCCCGGIPIPFRF